MPYPFLAESYIPILEAGSLLAFGDRDYIKHLTEERFIEWRGQMSTVPKDCCPELDCELDRLIKGATSGQIVIIGRKRAVGEWHSRDRHPPINSKYEEIPASYFQFNDWSLSAFDPFCIIPKGSDPFGAEWFYLAVLLQDVEKLRGVHTQRASGRHEQEFWALARPIAMEWLRDNGYPSQYDGRQAKLEGHISQWLIDHQYSASERTIRTHAKRWINDYRAEVGVPAQGQ